MLFLQQQIAIKLFKNVQNVAELRKLLSEEQLANKAFLADVPITKSIYTEILYNLSISKHITNSLNQFGVAEGDMNLLFVSLAKDEACSKMIQGDQGDLVEDLKTLRDDESIRKAYKLTGKETDVLDTICSKISTKDFFT